MSATDTQAVGGYSEYPPPLEGGGGPDPVERRADRLPPQDVAAEQSVLGSMLMSKDAIADVVEVVRATDYYRPAHEAIHEAILDLYGRGEPADALTVKAVLERRGDLARVGGPTYLHDLMQAVPSAANASYYAEIVREKAVLRRLVEASTRIGQLAYSADGEIDSIVDRAQAEIYGVTERRAAEDYKPLSEIMESALDEIEAISARDGKMVGVPTGFTDLDALTNGLHAGQLVIVAARPGMGKALALDTPLPTPNGWTTMGDVRVGDRLIDANGRPTRVVAATEVMLGRPCYEVLFSDGTRIVADAEHQWPTEARATRRTLVPAGAGGHQDDRPAKAVVRTTAEIAATLRCDTADQRLEHSVANARPLQLPERALPVPPYALGAWLGDGDQSSARITTTDPEVVTFPAAHGLRVGARVGSTYGIGRQPESPVPTCPTCPDCGGKVTSRGPCKYCWRGHGTVQASVRSIGLLRNKHIPAGYQRASEGQRRALLAGLLDAEGTVTDGGAVQFCTTSKRLADDTYELIVGLGYRCSVRTEAVEGRSGSTSTAYLLNFSAPDDVFWSPRKAELHASRRAPDATRSGRRYVSAVRAIRSVPVRCVEVDNSEHLYLAGESMIPTHNSALGLDFARAASIHNQLTSVIFSLEMSRTEITMRLLSAEARVPMHHIRQGAMTDDDWARMARRMGEVSSAPMYIDDSPNMTMMEIRAKARRLRQRHDLRLIILDYLQLMTSGKKVESRQVEVSEFSRNLKLLAKELEVPIVALAQLNRGPEQRTDKRPMTSDLRESGCLTASTRILRADTGAEVTMGELYKSGAQDIPVWSLDDRLKLVPRTMTHVFSSGVKDVFRLRLASGREIEATANHPILTYDGWRPLGELAPGSRLAIPRHVPAPLHIRPWDADEVVLLAHLIGDGSFVRRQPIRYASVDEANLDAVAEAARRRFGITPVRDEYPEARVTTLRLHAPFRLARGRRNPIAEWLDGLGLFGLRSHEKFVPEGVFSLPKEQIALFLRHLWATDGSIQMQGDGQSRIYYASTSRRLVDDIARLLLRFNIVGRVYRARKPGYRDGYHLQISGVEDQTRFLEQIGAHGARGAVVPALLAKLRGITSNTNIDTVPKNVWDHVREALVQQGISHREFAAAMATKFSGSTMWKHAPSRTRLAKVATVLGDAELEMLATNDVLWDRVASIEPVGEQEVFDATVLSNHNFVANGINLHNSLEQDADMVLLLHREDAYERESSRPGEADIIVAKHRNGPTANITVAFQGHYSRFVDMAQG